MRYSAAHKKTRPEMIAKLDQGSAPQNEASISKFPTAKTGEEHKAEDIQEDNYLLQMLRAWTHG